VSESKVLESVERDTYERPELTVHGDLQALTQGTGTSAKKDNGSQTTRVRSR
jgi:hypothetical protein